MAWHKIFALGLVGSALAIGCTVTSGDPDDDDDDPFATGGRNNTGGSAGTGGSTGGTATGGAMVDGGSTGGAMASGGSAGMDDAGPTYTCDAEPEDEACQTCVKTKCCSEWLACDDEICAGTDDMDGEAVCIIKCTDEFFDEMGFVDNDAVIGCASQCADDGSSVAENTSDLVGCILEEDEGVDAAAGAQNCAVECFGIF